MCAVNYTYENGKKLTKTKLGNDCTLNFDKCTIGAVLDSDLEDAEERLDDLECRLDDLNSQMDDIDNRKK